MSICFIVTVRYFHVPAVSSHAPATAARRRRVRQVDDREADAHPPREWVLGQGAPREDRGHQEEYTRRYTCEN